MMCTEKMDLVAAFYKAVGIVLEQEQHGNGPQHFSFRSEVCIEVYPPRTPPEALMVLRIDVADIDQVMRQLKTQFSYDDMVVREVESLSTGKKSIVKDPDGRTVELFQSFKP